MANIPPLRSEAVTIDGIPTLKFSAFLENLTGDVNNTVTEVSLSDSFISEISTQNGLISRLSERIDDLEAADDTDILNSRIAAVNSKVIRLIDELLEEVKKLRDVEFQNKLLSLQSIIVNELELLNLRSEEAWETDMDKGDTE